MSKYLNIILSYLVQYIITNHPELLRKHLEELIQKEVQAKLAGILSSPFKKLLK